MTKKERAVAVHYAKIIIKMTQSISKMGDRLYKTHTRLEAFKRNQPYFHESQGLNAAYNQLGHMWNTLVPEDIRKEAVDEWRKEQLPKVVIDEHGDAITVATQSELDEIQEDTTNMEEKLEALNKLT